MGENDDKFITAWNFGYIHFQLQRPAFDKVHLRRVFAAAFDRTAYINQALEGQGLAMKHLAPPVIFGTPSIDEVGVRCDLEFARAELAAAVTRNARGYLKSLFSCFL